MQLKEMRSLLDFTVAVLSAATGLAATGAGAACTAGTIANGALG